MIQLDESKGEHILTADGYKPISQLEYYIGWDVNDEYVKFREVFMLNGVVVKESAHAQPRKGLDCVGEQVKM